MVFLTREKLKQLLGNLSEQELEQQTNIDLKNVDSIIDCQTFNGLTNLISLDIEVGQLSTLHPLIFNGLTSLRYLSLTCKRLYSNI